jgi:hypothetical protein
VLLAGDEKDAPVEQVLRQYEGADVSGNRLHADLPELANEHHGRLLAGEWQGPLGWTRFVWCRR